MAPEHESNFSAESIYSYLMGDAPADRAREIEAQSAASPVLAEMIGKARELLESLRLSGELIAPETLLTRLRQLFETRMSVLPEGFETDPHRIVANLVADTREDELLAGYRGDLAAYQLTFEAEDGEVHLQVTPSGSERLMHVRGQVETSDDGRAVDTIVFSDVAGAEEFGAEPDETGYFSIELPVGVYDMRIGVGGRTIVVPAVEIG